jgi:Mg-chelatase subunit ChlD
MNWDERLFRLGLRLKRALGRNPAHEDEQARGARLVDWHSHLTLVARALSGEALEIQEAEGVGGVVGHIVYMPGTMSIATTPEANAQAYLYRLAYTITSRQQGFYLVDPGDAGTAFQTFCTLMAVPATVRALEMGYPLTAELRCRFFPLLRHQRPVCPALGTPTACLEMLTQRLLGCPPTATLPGPGWVWVEHCFSVTQERPRPNTLRQLWAQLLQCTRPARPQGVPPVVLWGQLMPAPTRHRPLSPGYTTLQEQAALPTGTELPGKPKEQVQRIELDQRDIDNDVLLHTFDKIETAEAFCGITRTPDGADDLAQHAEALDELDLRQVVRSTTRTQSVYRADVRFDTMIGDLEDADDVHTATFVYDEWDGKKRHYKPQWCHVHASRAAAPSHHAATAAAAVLRQHARTVREVRQAMDTIRYTRRLKNRQPDGGEVDLDAVVDRYATVRSGHTPDGRLYLSRRPHTRDLVTFILLDMSASTDAWIQGHRVLDIVKASILILGEVLGEWQDRVGIAGFYSHTRRDCRFVMVKSFDEPWPRCKATLASLEPTGYTRIGPALRHGIHLLQHEPAAKKLLLLISDGKPTDYDRYEGRYGIADVRQAIREAARARIHAYALAVDVQAKLYLPHMFGAGNFHILPHPAHLVRGLTDLYRRLSA